MKVVHCKKEKYDIYIGRGSKWGNPFIIGKDGDREEVIFKYRAYLNSSPELLKSLNELKDKKLGCYCAPKACHGDVLVELSSSKWIKNWFSNMLPLDYPIVENDIKYQTIENFYQAMKIPKNEQKLRKRISKMPPHLAKKAIRDKDIFKWREDWSKKLSLEVMEFGLRKKFSKASGWLDLLLLSNPIDIIEYNNWGDTFWGIDLRTMSGQNNLGKIIMRIRNEYIQSAI